MANFYPATNVANVALLKFYKSNRVLIRKWHFPEYTRLEQFSGYEGKMKSIFRDAEVHHIADGTVIRPPDPLLEWLLGHFFLLIKRFLMRPIQFSIQ